MKTSPLFCRALVLFFLLTCSNLFANPHPAVPGDTLSSYVVIGAFSKQQNAIRFSSRVSGNFHLNARFEMNSNRNLYYVYCLTTTDVGRAISEARRLRSNREFQDAWVYRGALGKDNQSNASEDINPMTHQLMEIRVAESSAPSETKPGTQASEDVAKLPANAPDVTGLSLSYASTTVASSQTAHANSAVKNANSKSFVFKLMRFTDQAEVKGEVELIDTDKGKKLASYEGNRPVSVSEPENKSGNISLVASVFGYRKMQRDINFSDPLPDSAGVRIDQAGNTVVPFELVRLKKGDFAIMYNVYFFRDAGIMRPESRFEVNSLVEMLKENPKYTIKIHGHTNGNHAGKIIYRDQQSTEFFSISKSNTGYGSARELSKVRAEEIRNYLIAEGIDPTRTLVKAWGGKKAIHDKHSARAQENVRVEIEILEDK